MSHENPLEIPEIVGLVASHLEGKDLARCVQVSKKWRDLLLPYRWRTVRAGSWPLNIPQPFPRRRIGPHPSDLYRHRHLIHDLSLSGDTAGLENYNYPNLRKLSIDVTICAEDPEREVFLELVEMFPSLVELQLHATKLASSSWVALSMHPSITSLRLSEGVIKAMDEPLFWEVCQRLESLSLFMVTFNNGAIPAGAVLDRLHQLNFTAVGNLAISDQLDLILRCPNLKVLKWHGSGIGDFNEQLNTDLIPKGYWHCLQELMIGHYFRDEQVASILEGVDPGNLVDLALANCCLGEQATEALRPHYATLVQLDISECRSVSSTVSRDVLSSCPRLKILYTNIVLARDVVNGGPWVCQQLKELVIGFLFGELELDLQQEVFRRLSTLTRLEYLKMRIPSDEESFEEEHVLEFRLENGLEQLATLQQLKSIHFDDLEGRPYIPQMRKNEALWMLTNWKNLKRITGELNDDPSIDRKLKSAFEILDIETEF
jgi:hypothetical protein